MTTPDSEARPTKGHVLHNWDPEDEKNWDSGIAWRTLWISTFSLIIGFCTWYLVSAIAPLLNDIGFSLSKSQLYWLTAIAGLSLPSKTQAPHTGPCSRCRLSAALAAASSLASCPLPGTSSPSACLERRWACKPALATLVFPSSNSLVHGLWDLGCWASPLSRHNVPTQVRKSLSTTLLSFWCRGH